MVTAHVVTVDPHSPDFTPSDFFVLGLRKTCMLNATRVDDLNVAATFSQTITEVQNDTWQERASR
jgi:hypothetical protein